MPAATLLALAAAVLHAGWNLVAKRSHDRFGALWGQFLVAGVLCGIALTVTGLPSGRSLWFAALSGVVHIPYVVFLARAYDRGEFSVAYPIARGGGVLVGAIGGALFLDDRLHVLSWCALAVIAAGIVWLGLGSARGVPVLHAVGDALVVAVTIGVYSTSDAHGSRLARSDTSYVLAEFVLLAVAVSAFAVVTGRGPALRRALTGPDGASRGQAPLMVVCSGIATVVTYAMVVAAFRRAPVGYVTGLRESSVVIAALVGWRFLGEGDGRRRLVSAAAIVVGIVLLVAAR